MKTIVTDKNFSYLGDALVEENKKDFQRCNLRFEKFKDQWPDLFLYDAKEKIEHKEVTYIGDFSLPESIFPHYCAIRGILDHYANKVRIIMPFFQGQQDRQAKKGDIVTAKYYADIMSHFPGGREGKTSLHMFDIHALQEKNFFNSFEINTEIHTLMDLIKEEIKEKNYTVAFPDEGAGKRFAGEFEECDKIICSKVRGEGDARKVSVKEGNAEGKNIIIIDDIIQSGNTILETADELKKQGALTVRAFAPHGIFPNDSHKRLAKHLDELITSDSIPTNREKAETTQHMRALSIQEKVKKIILSQ